MNKLLESLRAWVLPPEGVQILPASLLLQGVVALALFASVRLLCRRFFAPAREGGFAGLVATAVFAVLVLAGALLAEVAGLALPLWRALAVFLLLLLVFRVGLRWVLRDGFLASLAALVLAAPLSVVLLGLWDETSALLDGLAFEVGTVRLSAYGVLVGLVILLLLMWAAGLLARLIEHSLEKNPRVSPSLRVLLGKALKIALLVIAVVVAADAMGLDLGSLAIFSGALGLGLGFGLQKVISNLVSGFILLTDRSIKPGDVIEIDDTYGWINNLRARYVSIITRDGKEHLIPNEDLITQKVINWSFTDKLVRLKTPIGISYGADVRKAIALCEEAARSTSRVADSKKPLCLLKGFGDSSVDLELRFWIEDPANGVSNIRSEVLLKVWDAFAANGIEIPFPQRDLHVKAGGPLEVRLRGDAREG